MKLVNLKKNGLNRIKSGHDELRADDIENSIKSFIPGEWIALTSLEGQWLAFVNPLVVAPSSSITVLRDLDKAELTQDIDIIAKKYLKEKLEKSYSRRSKLKNYLDGCRLVYGASDDLPGLQVDLFTNACFIQINTAGIDTYREFVKTTLETLTSRQCYFLDNQKYREKESLPIFETEAIPSLVIKENGLDLYVRSEVLQKVGYYYDHRENRRVLIDLINRMNHKFTSGVDLFCYVGSWGLHALKSGVEHMSFVDQGDFSIEIKKNLELNKFDDRGSYTRADVFKYLDQCVAENTKFDLILSDPPAFAKSAAQKKGAIEGYHKLHKKVLKVAAPWSLIGFSSCTHYVTQEEFQRTIIEEAAKEKRNIHLVYQGLQGWDHPVKTTMDKANYIKSFFYIVE